MKNLATLTLLGLLVASGAAAAAEATSPESFGVSPVQLTFTDPGLMRGQTVTGTLTIQNRYHQPTDVTIAPTDDLEGWVAIEPGFAFTVPADSARAIAVHITVPETAANGEYVGALRIRATGTGQPSGSGASMSVEVLPAVRVKVGGEQVLRLVAENLRIEDRAPLAPVVLHVEALNRGNVRAAPSFDLVVVDERGAEHLRERLDGTPIEPGARAALDLATQAGLPLGSYVAKATLVQDESLVFEGLSFDVKQGASSAQPTLPPSGTLGAFRVEPAKAAAGRPVAFALGFINDGRVDVQSAKLTVEVLRDGAREAIVSSEPLRVATGATMDLEAFYTPQDAGTYTLKAYITYDGIRTPAKEGSFLVAGPDGASAAAAGTPSSKTPGPGLPLVVVALAGIALLGRRTK